MSVRVSSGCLVLALCEPLLTSGGPLENENLLFAPPKDFNAWQPFAPSEPYPLGKYMWRD